MLAAVRHLVTTQYTYKNEITFSFYQSHNENSHIFNINCWFVHHGIAILFPGSYVSSIISTVFVSLTVIHSFIHLYVYIFSFIGKKEMALVSLIRLFNFFFSQHLYCDLKMMTLTRTIHSIWFSLSNDEKNTLCRRRIIFKTLSCDRDEAAESHLIIVYD